MPRRQFAMVEYGVRGLDLLAQGVEPQAAEFARAFGEYDAEAIAAVDTLRVDHGLDYTGSPAGLADARLVDALSAAHYQKRRAASEP